MVIEERGEKSLTFKYNHINLSVGGQYGQKEGHNHSHTTSGGDGNDKQYGQMEGNTSIHSTHVGVDK